MPIYKFHVENFTIKNHEKIDENIIVNKRDMNNMNSIDSDGNGYLFSRLAETSNPDKLIDTPLIHH
jgi:hypothetical protein